MNREEQSKLRSSIKYDDYEMVINLLKDLPVNINIIDGTPLNYAIIYDKNEIAKYFINKGADVNALYDGDYSSLMLSVDRENIEIVKLLLENEADINLKDKHGNGALWKAVFKRNLDIIKLLVAAGADPFVEIKEGWNIYDGAKHIEADEIVEYFDNLK